MTKYENDVVSFSEINQTLHVSQLCYRTIVKTLELTFMMDAKKIIQ